MKKISVSSLVFIMLVHGIYWATVINIPADYPTIQQGIDAGTDGDTVLVQPGMYVENINFNGHNIVLGSLFLTTGDTSCIEQTVIDGDSAGSVVRFWGNEDSTAAISGFTLQSGNAEYGGGISCYHSTPRISHNIIRLNVASEGGGGIDCYVANPSIIGNSIIENSSGFTGGGIYCNGASPLILNNSISDNWTRSYGGGIYCRFNANASIIENEIIGNYGFSGGGIYVTVSDPAIYGNRISGNEGHGIFCIDSNAEIRYNVIYENSSRNGAGIYADGDSAPIIEHNSIYRNVTTHSGSGIYCGTDASIINNTISGNISGNGGGGIANWYCASVIKNNIIWGNVADFEYQIYVLGSPTPLITYCDIQGGWAGEGNINENPLFVNPSADNFHLMATECGDSLDSPCIDAGDPNIIDSLLDCSWGLGGPRSDMGAFGGGDSIITNIESQYSSSVDRFSISQNYPNPFNSFTIIEYDLHRAEAVEIVIYDILGRRVETLLAETIQPSGRHSVIWRAENYPSGIYLYAIRIEKNRAIRKCILLK